MTASLPVGVFETDTDFRLLAANDAFRLLALGGGPVVQGTAPWSHAVPHVRTECERAWLAHSGDPASFSCEFPVPSPDGSTMWVRINSAARLDGGRIIGWVGSAVDVTPVVEQSSLSDQLVGLLDVSGDAVVVFDRVGSLTFANDTARSLLGVDPTRTVADDIAARTYMQAVRDQLPRFMLETGAAATNRWEGEIAFRSPDGLPRTLTVIVQVVRESDGTVHHWATIARDITEERQARAELDRLATHDALTRLPNRVLFLRKTTEALERAGTTGANVAVLFIDLDKLKHVNDTIGHAVGDQLIVSIARRLASATRPSDTVARISGDEFVVLCEGVLDEHVALDVAERVRTSITGQVVLQGIEIETGASIGVALATDDLLTGRSPSFTPPTRRCTRRSSAAAGAASCTASRCAPPRVSVCNCRPSWSVPSRAASWTSCTNPSNLPMPAGSALSRPSCAGTIPCAGSSPPPRSWSLPMSPASSGRSATGCSTVRAATSWRGRGQGWSTR
ncbi:MAG: hypothetical protein RJA51_1681, partial [Actinomycetota bacterium]